ncbi:MAG: hypothetical protein K0S68_727 [Candidatus Saccharibacteria bacterium]|jgi:hypothetical protein|nr:hypothetical protein [Candidatus Saccharibacteria bacterium]
MNKIFENEQQIEHANRKVTTAAGRLSPKEFPKDFVLEMYCECANKACQEKFTIAFDEYVQHKKENLNAFAVLPEHYLPEFERLVKQTLNYWIIAKKMEKLDKQFEV